MNRIYLIIVLMLAWVAAFADEPAHEPKHAVESIVFDFIKDLKSDVYDENIFFFQSDTELAKEDRIYYFRRLETFVRNNTWDLYFTAVDIYDGEEDIADVILKAASGDIVIFIVAYWYDTKRWELDGYEFPGLTYDRPEEQSYEDYVDEIVENAKSYGVPYAQRKTITDMGTYYIEYK
ncbi:hypothetical protein JXB22_09035 [candidate division WOR-3 bacterium]|nr:hypothetical protein [candidate division WOR-3 bacterium]